MFVERCPIRFTPESVSEIVDRCRCGLNLAVRLIGPLYASTINILHPLVLAVTTLK
jgi:hypothetical protein